MTKTWSFYFTSKRFICIIRNKINTKFTFRSFSCSICFSCRNIKPSLCNLKWWITDSMDSFISERLEGAYFKSLDFIVPSDNNSKACSIIFKDSHFFNTNWITVKAISIRTHWNIKIYFRIDFARKRLS